ncbi:MAG TPA: cytochrome c biogenesis CcdA family protein [Aestuariivirgaceae bacterium]|jgi:cytochrome c-type biogenesis protein
MIFDVSLGGAFLAGLLSFLSPCVLPLVPPYLCYITGFSLEELAERKHDRHGLGEAVLAAVMFVAGFSAVFVAMGATASVIGQLLREHLGLLAKISGVFIIVMGLHFLGAFNFTLFNRQAQYRHQLRPTGLAGAFVIGLAFAFGWTPCIGPVLAAILAIAAGTESISRGSVLLSAYSAGLGVPFIVAAAFLGNFLGFLRRFRQRMATVEKVMGALLVVTGVLFITGSMQVLSYWFLEMFPALATLG